MSDQEFQLSTTQICAIFSQVPPATKVFIESSMQGYPTRFVGDVTRVLGILSHEAQEDFPQLNICESDEGDCGPLSIDAVNIMCTANIVDSFDATEEYSIVLDCNLGESNDLLPALQYLEDPIGPNRPRRLRRSQPRALDGEHHSDDKKRVADERVIEVTTEWLNRRQS